MREIRVEASKTALERDKAFERVSASKLVLLFFFYNILHIFPDHMKDCKMFLKIEYSGLNILCLCSYYNKRKITFRFLHLTIE